MSLVTQILKSVQITLFSAVTATGRSSTYALPPQLVSIVWQTSYNSAPSGTSVTLDVSLDGVNWTTIDTSTNTSGEVRTVTNSTAAPFISVNFGTNTGGKALTVTLECKAITQ